MINKKFNDTKDNIVNVFSLPNDVISKATIVHIIGKNYLYIENYKGILTYTNKRIDVKGYNNRINVSGDCLNIDYYGCEDMKIRGCIDEVKIL